ncbi:UbiH/UbiF/VisC/COQ6 family ubiquinone biosynthesis hydroxylase [Teredinibacter purpureus]|uniref:UbiH/UbiF/VisC/COQ6 family ubiquinone biosynthesis hydroxylase n=1 Tax=Teredinibacter purpureus TaxID=2731756 RepID=UPI0005F7B0A9|nr:UbiH/UbiF/VisC/COQ6 family ubiquinone biosynthesis hydroxylase [Teredinibacter purpureus]
MNTHVFDVVIVGGGMVGLSLAARLASCPATASLTLAVIEAGEPPRAFEGEAFDPRVVALSKKSEAFLMSVDAWQPIVNMRACAYHAMDVWDAEGTGNIQFHADDIHVNNLGHIVENSVVVKALRQRVQALPSVTVLDGMRVESFEHVGPHNQLQVSNRSMHTKGKLDCTLVVAADGAHSKLRAFAGISTREWDYGHTAIVTTVKTEKPHQQCCWQRFTTHGPIAFLPLQAASQQQYCSLVWSVKTELADALMALDDAEFCARLSVAFESRLGEVVETAKRFAIPLRQRHAIDYIGEGIALVGDAAHTIHPLAGQGVNLGLYDVQALATEIERACERGVALSDSSILRRFQRQRKSHNLSAMASMEGFKRLFEADIPAVRWVRNVGMSLANNQLLLKRQLAKVASGF